MAHSHSHSSVQAPDNSNARRLLWAFIVTAGFMLIEAVGGAISGSLALLADAPAAHQMPAIPLAGCV